MPISGEALLKKAEADYNECKNNEHHILWRKEAAEDFDFVAGGSGVESGQWEDEALEILADQDRPAVTFNRIEPLIEGITGTEINNRLEPIYEPHEPNDTGVAQLLTDLSKWARDNDVEEEESDAFRSAVICGVGATIATMEYDEDLDGRFTVLNVNPLGLRWDTSARRSCLSDSSWCGYVEDMRPDQFAATFGEEAAKKASKSIFGDAEEIGDAARAVDSEADYDDPNAQIKHDQTQGSYLRVFQYEWTEMVPVYRIPNPDGSGMSELSESEFNNLQKGAEERGMAFVSIKEPIEIPGVRYVRQAKRKYYRAFFSGSQIIEEAHPSPYPEGYTIRFITARRHHNKGTFYGIVRPMKDPQMWGNKFLSQMIHQYNSNIKGGMLYEEDAVPNVTEFERNLASPAPAIKVNSGKLDAIKQLQPAPIPPALGQMHDMAVNAVTQVTGISDEFIGMSGRDQPIGLEQTRRLATMTIMAPIFSSYRKYRKGIGRLFLSFVLNYFQESTIRRVVADENKEFIPQLLGKGMEVGRFDVHVEDAPLSPSMKATVFSVLKDFLQFITDPVERRVYMREMLPYSPLPTQMVTNMLKAAELASKPDPMAEQAKEVELQTKVAELVKTHMEALLIKEKALTESGKSDLEQDKLDMEGLDTVANFEQTKMQMENKPDAKEK